MTVGDKDIWPSVIVVVGRGRSHPVRARGTPILVDEHHAGGAAGTCNAGLLGHVGKGPISEIVVEDVCAARISFRTARHGNMVVVAGSRLAGARRPLKLEIYVVRDKQVEMTIAIIVEKAATGPPGPSRAR